MNSSISHFPNPEKANFYGIVAEGGLLNPEWLLDAYIHGIFPMQDGENGIIEWWTPNPRAIIEYDLFHISSRLRRTLRKKPFRISTDVCFKDVMIGCAENRPDTWITSDMIDAYTQLFHLGFAHSLEVWDGDSLVGGTYGVAIGAFFAAESKFHRKTDASKIALAYLIHHLCACGFSLVDVQFQNSHIQQFGVSLIPRCDYLRRLRRAVFNKAAFKPLLQDEYSF